MYFGWLGVANFGDIVVESPVYFSQMSEIINSSDISDVKAYLKFHVHSSAAPYLSERFVQEDFKFYQKVLYGVEVIKPRWRRVLSTCKLTTATVSFSILDPVSKLYVKKQFPAESKKAAFDMIQYIITSFKEAIESASWMEEVTKANALTKLHKFGIKVGYVC
jgi:putative endopeptidase